MDKMLIRTIEIKGFKSIKDATVHLQRMNIFVGNNGVGKSNFLDLINIVNAISQQRLQDYLKRYNDVKELFYNQEIREIGANISFEENAYGFKIGKTFDHRLVFKDEYYINNTNFKLSKHYAKNHLETKILKEALNWPVYRFDLKKQHSVESRFFESDGSNLPVFLMLLKAKYIKDYQNILNAIRLVDPNFKEFIVNSYRDISLLHNNSDYKSNFKDISFGMWRYISLVTLLLQPYELQPNILIIDDPALALDLTALKIVCDLLKKVKKQVIITTNSQVLIHEFDNKDLIYVSKTEAGTIFA